jgi:hypothetical protein
MLAQPVMFSHPDFSHPSPEGLAARRFLVADNVIVKRNGVEAKDLRFFVAEFILSNVEGLLRMTGIGASE